MQDPPLELKHSLADLLETYGPEVVLAAFSEIAWGYSQVGLSDAGQWRRIFIALQDVVIASRQGSQGWTHPKLSLPER